MLIRYTSDIFYQKPPNEWVGYILEHSEWREVDADPCTLVNLYKMGHAVHISDRGEADCLILDLDGDGGEGMSEDMLERMHSPSFIEEVVQAMEAEDATLLQSASRNPGKAKLFICKRHSRQIEGNTDLAYQAERLRFETHFGIPCDYHMDSWTQITWGCRYPGESYLPRTIAAMEGSSPSGQPHFDRKSAGSRPRNKKSEEKIPEEGGTRQFVALYQSIINKACRRECRPDMYRLDFSPYCHTKEGVKPLLVRIGRRESTDIRVIVAAVYNAHYLNARYGKGYTEADAEATVLAVIQRHFEDAAGYLAENEGAISKKVACEWEKCAEDVQGYGEKVTTALYGRPKIGYTPRDAYPARLWELRRDEILAGEDPDELIAWVADGDVATIKALKRRLRNARRDGGEMRGRGRPKADYADVVASAPKDATGRPVFPAALRRINGFRRYLSEHGIKGPFSWR